MPQLYIDEEPALHGAKATGQGAAGERDELVGGGVEGNAGACDVVDEEAGGEVVPCDCAGGRGVDLGESVAHGVFAQCRHAVVVKVEGGDAGAGDEECAHVGAAGVVHAAVAGRESGEVRQGGGNNGQETRG